jgi:hypothetical protein
MEPIPALTPEALPWLPIPWPWPLIELPVWPPVWPLWLPIWLPVWLPLCDGVSAWDWLPNWPDPELELVACAAASVAIIHGNAAARKSAIAEITYHIVLFDFISYIPFSDCFLVSSSLCNNKFGAGSLTPFRSLDRTPFNTASPIELFPTKSYFNNIYGQPKNRSHPRDRSIDNLDLGCSRKYYCSVGVDHPSLD